MEKREKIKKIFKKYNVNVDEDYMQGIMDNPQRISNLIKMYKDEEINSMNEIFDKDKNNEVFTQLELEFVSKMDLFDPYMIKVAKMIWKQKDNPKMLKIFLNIAENEQAEDDVRLIKKLQEREVIT